MNSERRPSTPTAAPATVENSSRSGPDRCFDSAGLRIWFRRHLDGGGRNFTPAFVRFFRKMQMPRQRRVFEWCAGPGFIGFSLLGEGLCDTLYLADINPEAVEICRRTIAENDLSDRVGVTRSDNLRQIPPGERWDLVVANPPHYGRYVFRQDLRDDDLRWRIHREFFETVAQFLEPGGMIVLVENRLGSRPQTFRPMIEAAGLKVVFVRTAWPAGLWRIGFYFMGIARAGDDVPAWARSAAASG